MSHWETAGKSDEWFTPKYVFEALGEIFDLDPASAAGGSGYVPAESFYSENGLDFAWNGFVWLNPPYGGRNSLLPWLAKFFRHGNGICLVPDRTSAPWFQAAWPKAEAVLFTPKIKFERPDGSIGASPSNGSALFAAGKRAERALMRAADRRLGILGFPA